MLLKLTQVTNWWFPVSNHRGVHHEQDNSVLSSTVHSSYLSYTLARQNLCRGTNTRVPIRTANLQGAFCQQSASVLEITSVYHADYRSKCHSSTDKIKQPLPTAKDRVKYSKFLFRPILIFRGQCSRPQLSNQQCRSLWRFLSFSQTDG